MRFLGILAAACYLLLLAACGGGSGSSSTSTITVVGASCNPPSIASGQTSQCTASVQGTGSFSSTVTWNASGGGTIDAMGLFTAATVPFTTQVTITAGWNRRIRGIGTRSKCRREIGTEPWTATRSSSK